MDLGDPGDAQLRQLIEDLWQELVLRELNVSLRGHCWATRGATLEEGTLMCKMRRSPWKGEGMGTQQAASVAHRPPCIEENVGHFLSTLTARLRLGTQRINTFSGNATLGKTKVSFEQWYHEVQCVKDYYPELVVWESIVRSLKGVVADMAQYMSPTTSVTLILQTLAVIFALLYNLTSWCKISTRLPTVTMRRFPSLPWG